MNQVLAGNQPRHSSRTQDGRETWETEHDASELLDVIKKKAFTKIVCGLDSRRGTTVEAVKKKYSSLMANH